MKLLCSQSLLFSAITAVSKAVPSRPTHPILGNILLVADVDTQSLGIEAFDLSLGIKTKFMCQVLESGSITIPAKLLSDIISKLDGDLTIVYESIEHDEEGISYTVNITSSTGKYQVQGINAEDFPELPIVNGNIFDLPVSAVMDGLKSVFSASTDETKQVLTGVHLYNANNRIEFASTDGHRLTVIETEVTDAIADFQVTIPARTMSELSKLVNGKEEETVTLAIDESLVGFELGDTKITSRLLDGAYPNYQSLIPKEFNKTLTVERKRLINSVERVAVLADQKNNVVRFSLDNKNQTLGLSVETKEVGSGKETISCQYSGDNLEVAFNIKYLLDGLKALPTNEVQIQLNDAKQPVIITPLGGLKITYLIMPVQIREL